MRLKRRSRNPPNVFFFLIAGGGGTLEWPEILRGATRKDLKAASNSQEGKTERRCILMKSDEEIRATVERARRIVHDLYLKDERLKQRPRKDAGVVREMDIVLHEVLHSLLRG
jgi:hypothetical protein